MTHTFTTQLFGTAGLAGVGLIFGCADFNGRDTGGAWSSGASGEGGSDGTGSGSGGSGSTGGDDGGTEGNGATDGHGTGDGEDTDSIRLDVGAGTGTSGAGDGGEGGGCDGGTGGGPTTYKFSVLWVANSRQGTVSKIDTVTATEQARYYTGRPPDDRYDFLDPSRTSVSLAGDVVVANRASWSPSSSFTKVIGDLDDCIDRNGDGTIQTSRMPSEILPWGEDECVAWTYEVEGNGARAVAWEAGTNDDPCSGVDDAAVWVGYRHTADVVRIDLLDGQTGTRLGRAEIDDPAFAQPGYGIYGGAADADGNFWGNNLGSGKLVRVDRQDFGWEVREGGGYGYALDEDGHSWGAWGSGMVARTDRATGAMDWFDGAQSSYMRGVAIDREGHMWVVANRPCGMARFDVASQTWLDDHFTWTGCAEPVGVSIDAEGFVWVIDREAGEALKLEPEPPGQGATVVARVRGLVSPYTYSDMTGAGLDLVVNPPVG